MLKKLEDTEQHTGKNTFFCPSIYVPDENATRSKKNVLSVGGLWIDCDFKDYDSNEQAIEKLKALTSTIPPTATFFTGGGVHLYWLFTQPIPVDQWMPVARQWKSFVMGMDATRDPKTLANPATLMRLPGAWTEKRGQWVTGKYHEDKIYNFEDIRSFLGAPAPTTSEPSILDNAPAYAMGAGSLPALGDWSPVDATMVESNCRMCQEFRACGGKVTEPQWFAFAGLAKFLIGGEEWFHDISSGDPRYTQGQTQDYLDRTKADREAPTPCEELMENWGQDPSTNPCNDCSFKGQVRSPWDIPKRVHSPELDIPESITVPIQAVPLPSGYTTDQEGIIYKWEKSDKEGIPDKYTPVYEFPLVPLTIARDEGAETSRMFLTAKRGSAGWTEINIDVSTIYGRTTQAELARQGVLVDPTPASVMNLNRYIFKQYQHTLKNFKEHTLYATMGWTGDKEGFICGDRCYRPRQDVTEFTVSRDVLEQQKQNNCEYNIKGDLASWQGTVDEVVGHPGLKDRRAILAMGFGTPLVSLTSYASAVVAMWGESGCGKSGILRLISSIYGYPTDSHLTKNDTDFGFAKIIASIGAMPVCYDEITNMEVDKMKDMVFQVSHGRTKNAGTKEGGLRKQESWRTMMFTTANASIYDMLLRDHTAGAGGEIYRTLEIPIKPLEQYGIQHKGSVDTHIVKGSYGVAGEIWLQYIVDNKGTLDELMAAVSKKIVSRVGDYSPERFWTGLIGPSAVVSAIICKKLGIYNFDSKEIFETVCEMIMSARKNITGSRMTSTSMLEQYLRDGIQNTLLVSSEKAVGVEPPRNKVTIRIESDGDVFLSRNELMVWVKDMRQNFEDFLDELESLGYIVDRNRRKRLLSGTGLKSGPTRCLVLNAERLEDMEVINERAA